MANLKYSRQRECIRQYLLSTKEHPTADTVYMNVRKDFPNISLGTVYRNLNLLASTGEILKISTPNGGDRFDGNPLPHIHFSCTKCGKVSDMEISDFPNLVPIASNGFPGKISSYDVMFYGECDECEIKN